MEEIIIGKDRAKQVLNFKFNTNMLFKCTIRKYAEDIWVERGQGSPGGFLFNRFRFGKGKGEWINVGNNRLCSIDYILSVGALGNKIDMPVCSFEQAGNGNWKIRPKNERERILKFMQTFLNKILVFVFPAAVCADGDEFSKIIKHVHLCLSLFWLVVGSTIIRGDAFNNQGEERRENEAG